MIRIGALILVAFLSGCVNNASVKRVVADIEETSGCNTTPVYVEPTDDKRRLSAKIVVLNNRIDDCDNSNYFTEQKIKNYKSGL